MSKAAKPVTNIFGTGEASAWNPGVVPPAQKEQPAAPSEASSSSGQPPPVVTPPVAPEVQLEGSASVADEEIEIGAEAAAPRKASGKKVGRPAKRDRTEPMTVRMPLDLYERLATEARKAKGLRVTTPQQVLINILRAHYEGGTATVGDVK